MRVFRFVFSWKFYQSFWKVVVEQSNFFKWSFSSDCRISTKDFTLNESALSNWEVLPQILSNSSQNKKIF